MTASTSEEFKTSVTIAFFSTLFCVQTVYVTTYGQDESREQLLSLSRHPYRDEIQPTVAFDRRLQALCVD